MPEVFFTSDTHFGHANILAHCARPFSSVGEMDEALIANWNARVPKGAEVYHLGDFAWKDHLKYKSRLNGKIHWVLGNHDRCSLEVKSQFTSVNDLLQGRINGTDFFLLHYPLVSWARKAHGCVHLYGHVHGRYSKEGEASLDVGVDVHNFTPLSLEEVAAKIKTKLENPCPSPQ